MQPLQRPSLTTLTAEAVLDLIRDRRLRAGDRIPVASELAATLGVSRTVIREAIAELAGQGLLKRQQGSHSVITVPGSAELERLMRMRFTVQGGALEHAHELRESIEVRAAELAAERATDVEIDDLRRRLHDLRAAGDSDELHRADLAFHRAVVEASHNDLMQVTIDAVTPLLDELLTRVWEGWGRSGKDRRDLVEGHALILESIEARDGMAAARAMRANLAQGREGLAAAGAVTAR